MSFQAYYRKTNKPVKPGKVISNILTGKMTVFVKAVSATDVGRDIPGQILIQKSEKPFVADLVSATEWGIVVDDIGEPVDREEFFRQLREKARTTMKNAQNLIDFVEEIQKGGK